MTALKTLSGPNARGQAALVINRCLEIIGPNGSVSLLRRFRTFCDRDQKKLVTRTIRRRQELDADQRRRIHAQHQQDEQKHMLQH